MLPGIAAKALEFYGGAETWNGARFIDAEVSVSGFAFTLKRRPFFDRAKIFMDVARPVSKLTPIGNDPAVSGILDGNIVRLETATGEILAQRENPRKYFPFGRRLFYWDDLDMAYFANYAFWNYFTLPRLLMSDEISWSEVRPGLLQATFHGSLPTHCRVQLFHFDTDGRLLQHDYSVNIISKYAKVANKVTGHAVSNGIIYPSARIVTPQAGKGKVLTKPVMIDIKVHSYSLITG